jgi:hypothetical protein
MSATHIEDIKEYIERAPDLLPGIHSSSIICRIVYRCGGLALEVEATRGTVAEAQIAAREALALNLRQFFKTNE